MIKDTFKTLTVNQEEYNYYSLPDAAKELGISIEKMPFSRKILFENLLRNYDNNTVTLDDIKALATGNRQEIAYRPARVLMQDFTGVPAVVDLAAMREAVTALGGDPKVINPLSPVDLVIDHSVQVDQYASTSAFAFNVDREMERNNERYSFLRWGQETFNNFNVVPPGTGICHQVNLEYLAQVVWTKDIDGKRIAFPDTLVGTDSHTTMINGLAVLGWGVGGIEAEAAMLGQPISMLIPDVVGFKLTGNLKEGTTATDLVLTIVQILREKGVVGKFVEFYGPALDHLPVADRATIANMAPEYGATCGFFPIDQHTLDYMKLSARNEERIALVEAYAKAQDMWRHSDSADPEFTDTLELDISTVEPSVAGPKRPQDKILLSNLANSFAKTLKETNDANLDTRISVANKPFDLGHGDLVIAAITSCTNTSNPSVMVAAGLLAQKAIARGLSVKPWVKTSLAPGSKVVTEYLEAGNLQTSLDQLGFNLVGYGCTTCIGNSGPLDLDIEDAIRTNDLTVGSILSGNRNFEGRVHPLTRVNYLASPPLVVAYAIAGSLKIDITKDPLTYDSNNDPVYLKDIWPSHKEINDYVLKCVTAKQFALRYADVFTGDEHWQKIHVTDSMTYDWQDASTYVKLPPYFDNMTTNLNEVKDIHSANILALLGDSITTDHISPAGSIAKNSPAATYLKSHGVEPRDFNSYGSRRGNHEVMMRGTFANIRIKNEMLDGTEGGYTLHIPSNKELSIFDAAMEYKKDNTPLVIIAGKEYGTGSSRDWAAKGTNLLGVKAVITESFERIHRSNLVGMGVLPLTFPEGVNRKTLELTGHETISLTGLEQGLTPNMNVACTITYTDGKTKEIQLLCRLDTANEVEYYLNSGILHKVLRDLVK